MIPDLNKFSCTIPCGIALHYLKLLSENTEISLALFTKDSFVKLQW